MRVPGSSVPVMLASERGLSRTKEASWTLRVPEDNDRSLVLFLASDGACLSRSRDVASAVSLFKLRLSTLGEEARGFLGSIVEKTRLSPFGLSKTNSEPREAFIWT